MEALKNSIENANVNIS